ncbi:DPP IV N-terminal domain-containing protein [Paludibacter propionicigenes]|nr:DPP IV N-terminal domain-containing protein [Paludibacter propionicigenes]
MKTNLFFCILVIASAVTFASCSKDDESTITKKEYTGIYFMDTDNEDIETIAIAGGTPKALASGISGAGIAYDKVNEKIYYSDFADSDTPNGKIWKMDVGGTNPKVLVSGIQDPHSIALDLTNGKVYWGDGDGNVSRCNLNGDSLVTGFIKIDGGAIRSMALDPINKKLYFCDTNNNNLYMSNQDGSSTSIILSGYYGYAIAVDNKNNKIYFDAQSDDGTVSGLYRANLDGTNPVEIDNTQSRIYGIALDVENSKVYWSGRDTKEIYQANLNGTKKVTLATGLGKPRGIFLKY